MPERDANTRYSQYVNDQVDRIYAFKEEYEAQHNTPLGDYPFTVEGKFPIPNVSVQEASHAKDVPLYKAVEDHIHEHIITEYITQTEDPENRQTYRQIQEVGGRSNPADQLNHELSQQNRIATPADTEDALHRVLTTLEQRGDHPTLTLAKEVSAKGVRLTPSPEEKQLSKVYSDMENHYSKTLRPSQQMEQLILKAETEARTLDRTLDQILELEEQGVDNPLSAPEVAQSPEAASKFNEREVLKAWFRKKQQGGAQPQANNAPKGPSNGPDL